MNDQLKRGSKKAEPDLEGATAETTSRPRDDDSGFEMEFAGDEVSSDLVASFGIVADVRPRPSGPATAAGLGADPRVAEEFRRLVSKIRAIGETRPFRAIGVTSTTTGEGKTTLAIGLAAALSREPDRRILLLEADLRKPAVEAHLGLAAVPGVGEWLRGEPAPIALRNVAPPGFALLSGGNTRFDRPELLGAGRMAALLQEARAQFDYIIVDCPPLLPVADAVILQDLLDGFLFVVRARSSPRELVQRALEALKPGRVQGVVLNANRQLFRTYDEYYYGYE
jgi:capsular exopolysaccharide synthesis family protein